MRCALLGALCLATACSSLKTYEAQGPDNVRVNSALSEVRAAVHVYGVEAGCRTEYLGSVQLDRPAIALSLPSERPSYLVFSFDSSSWLAGSRTTSVATLIRPRPGYRYEIAMTYRDSLYDVRLRESDPRSGRMRELARRALQDCTSL